MNELCKTVIVEAMRAKGLNPRWLKRKDWNNLVRQLITHEPWAAMAHAVKQTTIAPDEF